MSKKPNNTDRPCILLASGGTGGHLTPAQALSEVLEKRGYRVVLVSDHKAKMLEHKLPMEVVYTAAGAMAGKNLFAKFKSLLQMVRGYFEAWSLLRKLRPVAVAGFGGYSSLPTCLAAAHRGTPLVIHEQNSVLGRANRWLTRWAGAIAVSYPDMHGIREKNRDKLHHTGNPVRQQVLAASQATYSKPTKTGPFRLLITGGSQGAHHFSRLVPQAISLLPKPLQKQLHIVQQVRREDMKSVQAQYKKLGLTVELKEFFQDITRRMVESHLIISRAGASTLAETCIIGRPAILVPYPYAIYDHQTLNAAAVEKAGAGWMMPQTILSASLLADKLQELHNDPQILTRAAADSKTLGRADAAVLLADLVEQRIK